MKDFLLARAMSLMCEFEDILTEVYNGKNETEELFKELEEICNDLSKTTERLRLLNGKFSK